MVPHTAPGTAAPVTRLPPLTRAECLTLRNILLRTHPASRWEAGFIESIASMFQAAAGDSQGRTAGS